MIRVLFVHPSHPNQLTRVAYRLAELPGWRCAFLVDQVFAEQVRAEDPPVPFYGFPEPQPPVGATFYLESLEQGVRRGATVVECLSRLRERPGFDVVVGHASFGATFFARQILGVPVVSYVELPGHHCLYARRDFPAGYPHALMDLSFRALVHESVLRSDLCVVPSEHARSLLPAELQPRARVRMEGFRPAPPVADRAALRAELGLPPEASVVGFAGRSLEAVRGFDVFVRAAARIRAARPDARFLVIGDEQTLYGGETAYLDGESFKRRVMATVEGGEEGFLFRPFMARDEFVRHLQAMDLALFPIFEGAGNWGPFEAMAAGLPVLASDRCFLPEVITHGRDGLLLDAEDAGAFAAAALDLLAHPERRRRLGAAARRTIARRFSEEAARDGYAAILSEALGLGAGGARPAHAAVA